MSAIDEPAAVGQRLRPGPGGLPHGRVTEIQRSRILTAAVQTVEEVGYAQMTVARVISRAQVSRKTFYDLFRDREDCFLSAFDHVVAQARAIVIEAAEQESGWLERVRAGLAMLLQFMDDEPGLARLCVVEALGAGERVQQSRARTLNELATIVDCGRSAGDGSLKPPGVTAEGVVGAVFAVLHTRLLAGEKRPLFELLGPLMSLIVLPYLGARVANTELARAAPRSRRKANVQARMVDGDPLKGLDIRLTYRTVRVLVAIGSNPGASNREVAEQAEIIDQGQISKLLARLQRLELIENRGAGQARGTANAWHLTPRGVEVERAALPR
jgi:AcrR family transcriptional regulator/DNA-binding MarR family transcriptional regulator